MNNNNINIQVYAQKVELLLRLMPIVMDEGVFAVHGGTAINLFLKNPSFVNVCTINPLVR